MNTAGAMPTGHLPRQRLVAMALLSHLKRLLHQHLWLHLHLNLRLRLLLPRHLRLPQLQLQHPLLLLK